MRDDATYEANCPDGRSSSMFNFIGNAEFALRAMRKNDSNKKEEEIEGKAKEEAHFIENNYEGTGAANSEL